MALYLSASICGCTLRIGTLILAWLSVLGGVAGIILGIDELVSITRMRQKLQSYDLHDEDSETYLLALTGACIFLIVVASIQLTVSVLLILGVNKKSSSLFSPWILYTTVMLVIDALGCLLKVIFSFLAGQVAYGFLQLLFAPLGIAIGFYFLLIVKSYRKQIKDDDVDSTTEAGTQLKAMTSGATY